MVDEQGEQNNQIQGRQCINWTRNKQCRRPPSGAHEPKKGVQTDYDGLHMLLAPSSWEVFTQLLMGEREQSQALLRVKHATQGLTSSEFPKAEKKPVAIFQTPHRPSQEIHPQDTGLCLHFPGHLYSLANNSCFWELSHGEGEDFS